MRILLLFALLSVTVCCYAQPRTKYETKGVYQYAIRDYLSKNPSAIITSKTGNEKIVFFKKHNYTATIGDTLAGVKLLFIDPATFGDSISLYLKKKAKIALLDVQQPIIRMAEGQIWVMPMTVQVNPKKKTISEPEYTGTGCNYIFDYLIDPTEFYMYKSTDCKTFE